MMMMMVRNEIEMNEMKKLRAGSRIGGKSEMNAKLLVK
jgi:hypothetical protein